MKSKLSVIVPSLAGEVPQGLRAQVEGRADIELVVVKGVSPVGRARNEGLSRATGDYIAWVDGDDEVAAEWLAEILCALDGSPRPDVVVMGHVWVWPDGAVSPGGRRDDDLMGSVLAQHGIRSEMWNFVIRRELWDGIRFDETARILEDWSILPRLLVRCRQVASVRKPLYRYRINAKSLIHETEMPMYREAHERAVARIGLVRELGLWGRYRRETLVGIANTVCENPCSVGWMRRNLLMLFLCPGTWRQKVKWMLSAVGCRAAIGWYYSRLGLKT